MRIYNCNIHGKVKGEEPRFKCGECGFILVTCQRCIDDFGLGKVNEYHHRITPEPRNRIPVVGDECPSCVNECEKEAAKNKRSAFLGIESEISRKVCSLKSQ